MCIIKYIQENLKISVKKGKKDKGNGKRHRNVLNSLTRTKVASSVGPIHYKCSLSFSSSHSIASISTNLFIGHPSHPPRILLAVPLALNRGMGSSHACSLPSPAYGRLTLLTLIVNGSRLMRRERTPLKRTPGLSASDLSFLCCLDIYYI